MDNISNHNILSADNPISEIKQDVLGYTPFAKNIANILDNATVCQDCLVLAIHGEWGSGKSSAINLITQELKQLQQDKNENQQTTIVHFSPWLFTGQEDLIFSFFHELEKQLIGVRWKEIKENIANLAAATLPIVGNLLSTYIPGAKKAADKIKELIQEKPSLEQTRKILRDTLKEAKQSILIIIDDIDRLPPDEILQIFRMVKSIADFPYVTYLLAFDRHIVDHALKDMSHPTQSQWMEKIVQGSFDLPYIIPFRLQILFWIKLKKNIPSLYEQLDPSKISLFEDFLYPEFKTPRQVTRLINAVMVGWLSVKNLVDPAYFIIIEAWRLFHYDLYTFIKNNQKNFCGPASGNTIEQFTQQLMSYQNNLKINLITFYNLDESQLNIRYPIFNSSYFYRYFIYDHHTEILSNEELVKIEEQLDNFDNAKTIIEKFYEESTLDLNLSKNIALIIDWTENISNYNDENIIKITQFIFYITDFLIRTETSSPEYNIKTEIKNLFEKAFENIKDTKLQSKLLQQLYTDFPFSFLLTDLFLTVFSTKNIYQPSEDTAIHSILEEQKDYIKKIYQNKFINTEEVTNNLSIDLLAIFLNIYHKNTDDFNIETINILAFYAHDTLKNKPRNEIARQFLNIYPYNTSNTI